MSAVIVERDELITALGIRLRDHVTGLPIADGLRVDVTAWPPRRAPRVVATPSRTFAVHGRSGSDGWRITVTDPLGRFHAFVAHVAAGADQLQELPLWSLPARPVPAGLAAVRAQLGPDAAYAMLEVRAGASSHHGLADERGAVLVVLPYPPVADLGGSPPGGVKRPLAGSTWPLQLAVSLPRATSPPATAPPGPPELDALLDQIPAQLLAGGPPEVELTEATLAHGRELVLRSSPTDPVLLVRP